MSANENSLVAIELPVSVTAPSGRSYAPTAGTDSLASGLPSFSKNCIARCDDSPPCTGSADHQPARSEKRTESCAAAGTARAMAIRHAKAFDVRYFMTSNAAGAERCGESRSSELARWSALTAPPLKRAINSKRQTRPSSGSTTSPDLREPGLEQHALRGDAIRQRVRAHDADLAGRECEVNERARRRRCVALCPAARVRSHRQFRPCHRPAGL